MKKLLKLVGMFFLIVGTIGIFLPLLPTVPFYILSVIILAKVSKREIVKLKRTPFAGKAIYNQIKRSLRYAKRWTTR